MPQPVSQAPMMRTHRTTGPAQSPWCFLCSWETGNKLKYHQQGLGAAPLPAKKPHTCPVLLHLLERPVQRLQTSQPLLMFWTCWIHVIDKVFLKTTSWLKEKNNFGCLGFAQLALLAPVAVLQERFKVISTLNATVRPAACLLHQVTWGDDQNSNHTGLWEIPLPTPAHRKHNLPRTFSQTQNEIQAILHHSHKSS